MKRFGHSVAIAAVLSTVALAACEPVPHTEFQVVDGDTVSFRHLSGDGTHAVVKASGPGATVPGAGTWLVDRTTGTATALSSDVTQISDDAQRLLLVDNSIWAAGSVTPEPASGTRYSEDLTAYGFSVDTAPYPVNVADTDEPTAWNVLDLFAHPTGTFAVDPASIQVSNDGLTVAYEAERASGKVWRVVSKKHGTKVDIDAGKFDEVWLAPDGELFAALSTGEVNAVRARIIRTVDGEVLNEYEDPGSPGSTTTTYFKYMGMAESGGTVWLRREYRDGDGDVFGSTVVALGATTVRTWDVGPVGRVARADVSADGRFMVTDILGLGAAPEGPSAFTTVYDFLSDESGEEALPDGPAWEVNDALVCLWVLMSTPCTVPMKPARAEISDDGLIVATTTWTRWGWFEYSNPGA